MSMNQNPKKYTAFLFDLNGTMIDDMQYHISAWHNILNELGANISYERVREECYGKNHEMLERVFPGRFPFEEKDRMSLEKEKQYQEQFRPHLRLIEGLHDYLQSIHQAGIKTAIGSAAIRYNIDFVVEGLDIGTYINTIVSAEDVEESKPHPATFLICAERLQVPADQCLVFEDTPKGVEAALNAGMDCIVITTLHQPEEFSSYQNIVGMIQDYGDPLLQQLL